MANWNWLSMSLIAGILTGVGMILARDASRGMPSYVLVGILGFVWFSSSLGFISIRQEAISLGRTLLVITILAGLLFWLENIMRFYALPRAPVIANVTLTIQMVSVSITLLYDVITLYRKNNLDQLNRYHVLGLLAAILAIIFFSLSSRKD